MAIGTLQSAKEPYVHSNIINFRVAHRSQLLDVNGINRLQETIEGLKKIKEGLKGEATSFLGGITPREFMEKYYFNDNNNNNSIIYFEAFNEFLSSSSSYYPIASVAEHKLSDIGELIGKKISSESDKIISTADAINYIINNVLKLSDRNGKKGRIEYEFNFGYKQNKIRNEIKFNNNFKLAEIFDGKKAVTNIKKELKDFLKSYGNSNIGAIINKIQEIFKDGGSCEKYVSQKLGENFNNKIFKSYRDNFIKKVTTLLEGKSITSKAALSGAMGEEFFVSLLPGENGIDFDVTGSWSEEDLRKKLLKANGESKDFSLQENKDWKDQDKQSYSDIVLMNPETKKKVRIQSKYYQGMIDKINEGTTNINQSIKLFEEDLTIGEFIEKMQARGQVFSSFDPDGLGYAIANGIWFAHAGSINYEGKLENDISFDYRDIFTELAQGAGNFLGVIFDKNIKPIMEYSNIFFLINNRILLPTWVIYENLIQLLTPIAKEKRIENKLGYLSMNKGEVSGVKFDAELFKYEKSLAAGGLRGRNYQDSNLVAVGREKGREIIERIKMPHINLNINLGEALTSSYKLL